MKKELSAKTEVKLATPGSQQIQRRLLGKKRKSSFVKFATGLVVLVWLGAVAYFLVYPVLPRFQDWQNRLRDYEPYSLSYAASTQFFVALSSTGGHNSGSVTDAVQRALPTIEYVDSSSVEIAGLENLNTEIEIPAAGIKGRVVDGYSQEDMFRGFWHYPTSSIPGKKGNTVVFGHRYYKLPPERDTFFNLDKVSVGDAIQVRQQDRELTYTVVETRIVEKYDNSLLQPTSDYRLTLITCTPLWTAEKRLIVVAIQNRALSVA